MSDKPKVYQGVRVKETVKELLLKHRAREANRKNVKTISQACLDLPVLSPSIYPGHGVDAFPPLSAPPAQTPDVSNLQMCPTTYPIHNNTCPSQNLDLGTYNNFPHQLWEMTLPGNSDPGNQDHHQHHYYQQHQQQQQQHSGQSYPPSGLPLIWSQGLSSDADYYGPGMTSCSPANSLKLSSTEDNNSYSLHDSFSSSSSSSSSCYDSPSRESRFLSPEPYLQYSPQDSYNLGHLWPNQQESYSASECAPYYNSMDYTYPCLTEESYYNAL